jgi:cupin
MDPLGHVLDLAQVRGTVAATVHAGEAWGLDLAAVPGAAFHAVTTGTAWLTVPGDRRHHLMPGDVVLLPSGGSPSTTSPPNRPWPPAAGSASAKDLPTPSSCARRTSTTPP